MFHLDHDNDQPPATNDQLRDAILGSLRNELTLDPRHNAVNVTDDLLKVTVTDARVSTDVPPKRPRPGDTRTPGPHFDNLLVEGRPIKVDTADVELALTANGVSFDFDKDTDDGRWLLMLGSVRDGDVDVSIALADLRALIGTKVKQGADGHGVVIEGIDLDIASHGPRSVRLDATINGHKPMGFMKPAFSVGLTGNLEVDGDLVARLSGLQLNGDGLVMKLLTGLLGDKLKELEKKRFPLAAFPLGTAKLRDVAIDATDPIRVTAKFGTD
ncbi:MAG: hypothetical protein AAGD32_15040 [Planctomycetota bacterium]